MSLKSPLRERHLSLYCIVKQQLHFLNAPSVPENTSSLHDCCDVHRSYCSCIDCKKLLYHVTKLVTPYQQQVAETGMASSEDVYLMMKTPERTKMNPSPHRVKVRANCYFATRESSKDVFS